MKTLLALLSISLASPAIAIIPNTTTQATILNSDKAIINYQNQTSTILASEYIWEKVEIEHSVTVPAVGTHAADKETKAYRSTVKTSIEKLAQSNIVVAIGRFVYGTTTNPKTTASIVLYKAEVEVKEKVVKWQSKLSENTHEAWKGWGHHTCKINLTIEAKENDEGIIEFNATSWIYTRTAGAVTSPYTNSIVDQFKFE